MVQCRVLDGWFCRQASEFLNLMLENLWEIKQGVQLYSGSDAGV